MIQELDEVVLACDLPDQGLAKGDIGVVVLVHNQGDGFEVEFMTLDGETVAIETLLSNQVEGQRITRIVQAALDRRQPSGYRIEANATDPIARSCTPQPEERLAVSTDD